MFWAKIQKSDDPVKARIFGIKISSNGDLRGVREGYVVPGLDTSISIGN
jgi:hypothetical protein